MAGGDAYKEFDSSSIVSSANTQGTIKLGSVRLRKRDLVFGGIALFALLMVLVLAIVLAVEVGRNDDSDGDSKPQAASGQASASIQKGGGDECDTPPCLKAAHYQKSIMNESVQPCQDFYSFACGHFDENNPQTYMLDDVTPVNQIQLDNVIKMIDLITFPVDRLTTHSYERKLKHFFSSCTNHFDKMDLRGLPLVQQVLRPFGKTFLLDDDFDPAQVDLGAQLKKTHVDFWTAAFFTVNVVTDQEDWTKKVVELNYGGLGMRYQLYINSMFAAQAIAIYREYMTHVLSLVSIDAGVDVNDTRINTFIDDVIAIEHTISVVVYHTPELNDPHLPSNRMSLGELNTLVNHTLDFVDYMQYAFNEYPALFTDSSTVVVRRAGYFHRLGSVISGLAETEEGNRQLSNYLVWMLINRYSHDLSWDYIHAKRKLNNYLYGQKDDSSGAYYCFETARGAMADAMDAVFIKNHVKDLRKAEADKMLRAVRREVLRGINGLNWMSEEDKHQAHQKIKDSLYKIGYANYMLDEDYMDLMYYHVQIDESDYFGNMLNLNKLYRSEYNSRIGNQGDRTTWAYHIFDPVVEYWNPWHELIATAAVFQNPLFSHDGPTYYNYGSIGSIIAKQLIHAVDAEGSRFSLDKKKLGNWWGNTTREHYQTIRTCAIDVQKATSLGSYEMPGDTIVSPNITLFARDYVPELLADASGLRLAYRAYGATVGETGKDPKPVGFQGRTTQQLFFLAFAQANCQNTPDRVKLYQLTGNRYPSKAKVNLAVSQVPEFAEAFQCKQGQPMYPSKQCTLF